MASALAVRAGSSSASPFPEKMNEGAVSEGQAQRPCCCTGAVEVSLINESVTLGCYTVLLPRERCPRTGWKCRAPRGFPRCFSQPRTGLLPSSASAAAFAQVCAASSGVPKEDKELIISNYKLGSEHYAPRQGSKLMYLHCAGFWGAPRKRRWQQGKQLGSSGTGVTAAHPTAQPPWKTRAFGRGCGNGKCQRSSASLSGAVGSARGSTRDCAAPTASELAPLPKPHGHLRRGTSWNHAGAVTSWQSCVRRCCWLCRALHRGQQQGPAPAASPAVLPSCTGASAGEPTGRRCLSSP